MPGKPTFQVIPLQYPSVKRDIIALPISRGKGTVERGSLRASMLNNVKGLRYLVMGDIEIARRAGKVDPRMTVLFCDNF